MEGNVDPVRDIEIIHEELRLKDEEMIDPIIDKLEKTAVRGGDKKLKPEYVSQSVFCGGTYQMSVCTSKPDACFLGYHGEDKELGGG